LPASLRSPHRLSFTCSRRAVLLKRDRKFCRQPGDRNMR